MARKIKLFTKRQRHKDRVRRQEEEKKFWRDKETSNREDSAAIQANIMLEGIADEQS